MSRLIFSLLPRTRDGGEFLSPRQPELGLFRFMRMRPSRIRWSCYKRGSTEYRTKGRGAKSRALPSKYHRGRLVSYDSFEGVSLRPWEARSNGRAGYGQRKFQWQLLLKKIITKSLA